MSERLVTKDGADGPEKSLYAPLPRSSIKTMKDMSKSVKVRSRNVAICGESMYLRLLAVNTTIKKVPLERVMSFENAPVPLSMFTDDGTMLAGTKSEFMHKLEDTLPAKVTSIATADTIIFDGHAVIQGLYAPKDTGKTYRFIDMADRFLTHILQSSNNVIGRGFSVQAEKGIGM